MDKRAIIGIALSILVLIVYQQLVTHFYGPPPTDSAPEAEKGGPEKTAEPAQKAAPFPPASIPAAPAALPTSRSAKEIRVETDNYIAVFTTQGARLKSFKLTRFRSSVDENSPPLEIVQTAPGVPLPLGVRWQAPAPFEDNELVYSVQGGDLKLTGEAKATLVFQGHTSSGTVITKSFAFSGSAYPIQLEVSVKAADGTPPIPEVLLTDKSDHSVPNHGAPFEGFIALVDSKIRREPPAEAAKGHEFSGDVSWAGFGHTYFFFALLPDNGTQHKLSVHQDGAALTGAISGPAGSDRYTLFIGPKELDTLKPLGRGFERSIDFGYFGFISIPFLYVLHFFHRFTGSYGLDIILLTFVIKLLMAPLTHKSFVSMKQMQKLQPQMERLKERYSDDKEKLNKEIMELYRRNGVNPLGGCLPMVLQFPVFIGLYNALSTPIELRHAPFMWIKDLSRPDWESLPFTFGSWHLGIPILTIFMGASMFLQQWMTPSAGDPNQRKMMMLMPLMFTFMFVSFPAGLTVYWLVNNLLSIGQQYWINRNVK
ncbi:MAG TPA: membrane protein insertase YidC [Candidatus Binatia bacterium]|jgi:YidC/Oxa1 family membrane protein insertase|nr:membrane protein insertase YidC [Candidatus Binatia bacterium]